MEATRERPFKNLVCRDLPPQTRKRVITDLENISKLLGEFKIQVERTGVKICNDCNKDEPDNVNQCSRCGGELTEHKPSARLYHPDTKEGARANPNVQRVRHTATNQRRPVPKLQ